MTATPPLAEDRVRIERVVPASIERAFAAWTEPESMAAWLSPVGHAEVEADARVDGRFRVVMIDGDVEIEHTGQYLVVEPFRLLSFTWCSSYTGSDPSLVTVTFTPEGDETRVVLVHEQLPIDQVGPHAGGWGAMIDRLADLLIEEGRS